VGRPKLRKPIIVLAVIAAVAAIVVWRVRSSRPETPANVILLSGRIEGDDAAVSARVAGRIGEVLVREGDRVEAGQLIAVLDDDQIRAREEQAQAAVNAAEARVRAAKQGIAVLGEQLRQSQITVGQSRTEAEGRVAEAEANLASAEAQLSQAEASYKIAAFDRDAYTRLANSGAVSERRGRQAVAAAEAQAAVVASARKRVAAAKGTLEAARALLANPQVRTAQAEAIEQQIAQARIEVASAQSEAARAQAQLKEARANRIDLRIVAPFAGTVATRAAEPGEFAAVGTALITLVDLGKVYLRGYVPEGQIGKVKVGQPPLVCIWIPLRTTRSQPWYPVSIHRPHSRPRTRISRATG
jgi:HlyD family secretion protein